MEFSKWTGLGNDFVLLEPGQKVEFGPAFEQEVIRLCDRRFGIGADGVVIVTPMDAEGCLVIDKAGVGPASKSAPNGVDFEMRIFNADGSEAAMCGNATRCVAKFIVSRGLAKPGQKVFNLHTKSGLVKPELLDDGRVCVDMGNPRDFLGSIKLTAHCFDFTAETVSMGNPRAGSACSRRGAHPNPHAGLGTGLRRHHGLWNRELRNPRCGPAYGPRGRRGRHRSRWWRAPYQA